MPSTHSIASLAKRVEGMVKPERFAHILRVVELSEKIARANGLDMGAAGLAALLHDAARDLPAEELYRLAPPENQTEQNHPLSVHGRAARKLASDWGVGDPEVLEAIEGHVYGVAPQHLIGMVVYVADIAEPGREVNQDIRELALSGKLLEAYRKAVVAKVEYLESKGIEVHPRTLAAYQELAGAGEEKR